MAHAPKSRSERAVARPAAEHDATAAAGKEITDNRPGALAQRSLTDVVNQSPRVVAQRALAEEVDGSPRMTAQRKDARVNQTGLPDALKSGVEALSGMAMDNVRVHYNSTEPAQLNALAFAKGSDIHVAPGQEKHLPHEAWHVVQQSEGRVQPTRQLKGAVPINDDQGLEHEADVMGARALQMKAAGPVATPLPFGASVLQLVPNPDWSKVAKVTKSAKTQVGVFFVTGADGVEYVVKFEEQSGPEAFAAEFIGTLGGSGMAPDVLLVPLEGQLGSLLFKTLLSMKMSKEAKDDELALLNALNGFAGTDFIVMEKAPGTGMHQGDNPDLAIFKNPEFIASLGKLAAFDIVLANYDRLLMGLNLGNILHDPSSGRTTGIDQTTREKEEISGEALVENIMTAVLRGEGPSKWASKVAGLIEAMYEVSVNAADLDTGFVSGLLTMRANFAKLGPLMKGATAKQAGPAADAAAQRLTTYLEFMGHVKEDVGQMVAEREKDIVTRKPVLKKVVEKKKGCFITTACVTSRGLPDDCAELTELRAFRDGFMSLHADGQALVGEYYAIAPDIVATIDADPRRDEIYDDLYTRLVRRSLDLIHANRPAEALAHYRTVVLELKDQYSSSVAVPSPIPARGITCPSSA